MWFRKRHDDVYGIDTSLLTVEQQVDACRHVLRLVRPFVDRFQCDVPWDNRHGWPDDVVEAAAVLAPLPENASPKNTYRLTGWVRDFDEATWAAFTTFAPYAFAADAWTEDMKLLASLSDEGDRLSVRLSPDLLSDLTSSIPVAAVVPSAEWTRQRSEEWRLRINSRSSGS
ncbi:hypothetical protein [Aeromicrobium fastidiosum]|uniref:Uncharacterized protein n=1 Tax=Aeromicrobium fastidiosum TaxID=52699 RepID=A0A641AKX9_9ACTN|nr:hypothetical protein [Aeromicrobium fastidiosum]KAA1374564.1 hypothetical protein ESP62_014280 [Aeromicrobium fastidiosum]MBP2390899.1 hypothetical protein [Aeromicrobium fastidiosum]